MGFIIGGREWLLLIGSGPLFFKFSVILFCIFMFCSLYLIFFCFFTYQILQLNAFEEHNDIFAELWQKSEEIGTKSGNSKETLQTNSNHNFSQKIGKIKKEIVVKNEPNDYDKFDQFSNERQQKFAFNKTVKEENVEKRVKSEFIEFDRISDKEEFDKGKDGEEHNDIFAELWQKSEEIGTKSAKSEETLRTNSNDNFISQKIEKIKKVEKREFIEFDRISDKEEFDDNGKDGEEQSTDSYSFFDNLNLEESSSKSQKGVKKNYSEVEKQEIIAEFDELKKEFKFRANEMSYDMKKIEKQIARKLGVSRTTIYIWKKKFGVTKNQKKHTDAEKVELLENFHKIKKENPQLLNDEIAQMLNIHISTLSRWKSKPKNSKAGIKKNYLQVEKQEIIAKFDQLKKEFKTRAKGMSYNMKKHDETIAQKLGVALRTIYNWKKQFGDSSAFSFNLIKKSERSTSSANSLNGIPWK